MKCPHGFTFGHDFFTCKCHDACDLQDECRYWKPPSKEEPPAEMEKYFNEEYDRWVLVGKHCSNEELKQRVTALGNEITGYRKLVTKLTAMRSAFNRILGDRDDKD